jgi:hypothetical protein
VPSETSVDFQRTARRYIPEDSTLQCFVIFKELINLMSAIDLY